MGELFVNEHAFKHGLTKSQILYAWEHYQAMAYRGAPNEGEVIAVGFDRSGLALQMVAAIKPHGTVIFHAMTPPTHNAMVELGLARR